MSSMKTSFISLPVPKCPVSNCHHFVSVVVIVVSSPFFSQTIGQLDSYCNVHRMVFNIIYDFNFMWIFNI